MRLAAIFQLYVAKEQPATGNQQHRHQAVGERRNDRHKRTSRLLRGRVPVQRYQQLWHCDEPQGSAEESRSAFCFGQPIQTI